MVGCWISILMAKESMQNGKMMFVIMDCYDAMTGR